MYLMLVYVAQLESSTRDHCVFVSSFCVRFTGDFPLETQEQRKFVVCILYILYSCYLMFMNVHGICVLECKNNNVWHVRLSKHIFVSMHFRYKTMNNMNTHT